MDLFRVRYQGLPPEIIIFRDWFLSGICSLTLTLLGLLSPTPSPISLRLWVAPLNLCCHFYFNHATGKTVFSWLCHHPCFFVFNEDLSLGRREKREERDLSISGLYTSPISPVNPNPAPALMVPAPALPHPSPILCCQPLACPALPSPMQPLPHLHPELLPAPTPSAAPLLPLPQSCLSLPRLRSEPLFQPWVPR